MKRLFVVLGLIIVATSVRCAELEDNHHCYVEGRRAFDSGLPITVNPYPQIDRHEYKYVILEHISGYTLDQSPWQLWQLGWITEQGRRAFEAHLPITADPYDIQRGDKEKAILHLTYPRCYQWIAPGLIVCIPAGYGASGIW
jgi:hypothetical protein